MPKNDNLIVTSKNLNTNASHKTAYFSTLDLKYAYSQLILDLALDSHLKLSPLQFQHS